jgi:hypothetical protein
MGLVLAEHAAGDVTEAVALLASAIDDAEKAFGPRHPRTIAILECGRSSGLISS